MDSEAKPHDPVEPEGVVDTTRAELVDPLQAVKDADEPIALFQAWMTEATASEINDPNAAALATANWDAAPSVRMVLVKQVDERGFCFYTNSESRKGRELAANPHAALCFHWKSLERQVRVEGPVMELPASDADAYFHSRSRGSQLGASVSRQSRHLESREELEHLVADSAEKYPGEVPRPKWWKGYAIRPERVEFWLAGDDRLHNRYVFVRKIGGWSKELLFP
ncbi:MAG: pyridoxamine 5'-phosphate oxidase [Acidobacteria bacterium]|nr:pyridoxamine 5'-phosphate oxidase [Acidobacteriota bacterium]